MVCLGNICRSPLAEGILSHKLTERNLNWIVDSAGTSAFHQGEKPDARSIAVALENNIDINFQRSRPFLKEDLNFYDLILVMDQENYNNVLALSENVDQRNKVKMILNYSFPNQNKAVPDPYYHGGFDHVFQLLDDACEKVLESLVNLD